MSIFSSIMTKIFGQHQQAAPQAAPTALPPSTPAPSQTTPAEQASPVYVDAIIDTMAGAKGETLDWRHSIVDLMKALDLDSSLAARKQLAGELNYTGDTNDSASMNIWLHKEVMRKVAENGGRLSQDLSAKA